MRLPTAAALDNFSLSIYNGAVHLKKGLTFKELAVAVSNGSVEFPKVKKKKYYKHINQFILPSIILGYH